MRRRGAWVWQVAVGLGLTANLAAADDRDRPTYYKPAPAFSASGSSPGLLDRWFGKKEKPAPKPAPKPEKDEPKKPVAAKPADDSAAERQREQDVLLRRLKVCDKLAEIALQTRDEELQRMAEQLDERARTAYSQRVSHLPCSSANFESDEKVLDKHLGPAADGSKHRADVVEVDGPRDRQVRTARREEER